MTARLLLAITCGLLAFALLAFINPGEGGLYCLYDAKLRTPLFTGFLTLGGFLLTLKTFVLVQLKKELYDTQFYKERVLYQRELNPSITLYGPLARLGTLLIICVLGTLLASAAQFSIGFIPNRFAAALSIASAVTALILVFIAWVEIRGNLADWFQFLSDKAEDELSKAREKAAQTSHAVNSSLSDQT